MDGNEIKPRKSAVIPWWVKSIIALIFSIVFAYKIAITPWDAQVDFPTLLSLLLAFFSVGLAALFYFKATETSNAFYDNTYKFSQQIGELLARIESGFGERLRHLDEAYKGMRDTFERLPDKFQIKHTKQELEEEEEEAEKLANERKQIIDDLVAKAELREGEKERILQQLGEKEDALAEAREEIGTLRRRLDRWASERRLSTRGGEGLFRSAGALPHIRRYMERRVLPAIDKEALESGSPDAINKEFNATLKNLSDQFVLDLEARGLADEDGLTSRGIRLLREVHEKQKASAEKGDSH
jgi:hypothetical protein